MDSWGEGGPQDPKHSAELSMEYNFLIGLHVWVGGGHGIRRSPLKFQWSINLYWPPWMGGSPWNPAESLGFSMEYQFLWTPQRLESQGFPWSFYGISIFMGLPGWGGDPWDPARPCPTQLRYAKDMRKLCEFKGIPWIFYGISIFMGL